MKKPKHPQFNRKRRGEWAEVCFMAAALERGFTVAKPYGESNPYDFILDNGRRFVSVQVRSTTALVDDKYQITTTHGGGNKAYDLGSFDFLAALVVPCFTWYIFPIELVATQRSLQVIPHRPTCSKKEPFREAWHLLREG
jgi:hypothetical protein